MTDRELRRLSRADLLDMMIALSKENEQLRIELVETQQRLADRIVSLEKAGSIAEAALQLNGVFEAAQNACEQYIENMRVRSERCTQMEIETREKCARMLEEAERKVKASSDETAQADDETEQEVDMADSDGRDGAETSSEPSAVD